MYQAIFDEACTDFYFFERLDEFYYKLGWKAAKEDKPLGIWPVLITNSGGETLAKDVQITKQFIALICAL
jgi:hypothetical protein